jgi:hypothetical protein
MMVGMAVVTGTMVPDSGLSHRAFLGDLILGHAQGLEAVLDTLPSSLCRQPFLLRCRWWWWGMEDVVE